MLRYQSMLLSITTHIFTFGTVYRLGYRHTSFYCASQILRFLQTEGLWQPCVEQDYRHHYSNSMCSLRVSVSHFGNTQYFKLFHYYYYICYGDLWSVTFDVTTVIVLGCHKPLPYKTANLIDKCCVGSDCLTDWPFPRLSPSPQASLFPETQQYLN
jgi:hypothetical protein